MMDEGQQAKLNRWLDDRDVRPNCVGCGASDWAVGDIVSAPVQQGTTLMIGGPNVPMAQLVCKNCASILLFAAVPIGLVGTETG